MCMWVYAITFKLHGRPKVHINILTLGARKLSSDSVTFPRSLSLYVESYGQHRSVWLQSPGSFHAVWFFSKPHVRPWARLKGPSGMKGECLEPGSWGCRTGLPRQGLSPGRPGRAWVWAAPQWGSLLPVPLFPLWRKALPDPPVHHVTAQGIVHGIDCGHCLGNESGHLLWWRNPGKKFQSLCSSPGSQWVTTIPPPEPIPPPTPSLLPSICPWLDSAASKPSLTSCRMARGTLLLPRHHSPPLVPECMHHHLAGCPWQLTWALGSVKQWPHVTRDKQIPSELWAFRGEEEEWVIMEAIKPEREMGRNR